MSAITGATASRSLGCKSGNEAQRSGTGPVKTF